MLCILLVLVCFRYGSRPLISKKYINFFHQCHLVSHRRFVGTLPRLLILGVRKVIRAKAGRVHQGFGVTHIVILFSGCQFFLQGQSVSSPSSAAFKTSVAAAVKVAVHISGHQQEKNA